MRKAWDKYKKGKLNIYPQTSNSGPSFSKFVATVGSCTLYNQTCIQTVNPRKPLYTLISFQCRVSSEQLSSPLPFHAISSAFSLTSCLHHTYCATLFSFHHFGDMRRTHSKWCSGLWAIFFFTLSMISARLIDSLANCLFTTQGINFLRSILLSPPIFPRL